MALVSSDFGRSACRIAGNPEKRVWDENSWGRFAEWAQKVLRIETMDLSARATLEPSSALSNRHAFADSQAFFRALAAPCASRLVLSDERHGREMMAMISTEYLDCHNFISSFRWKSTRSSSIVRSSRTFTIPLQFHPCVALKQR
jgi:hypothetical protein